MRELLKGTGSIYVHIDHRTSGYLKVIMDEIFGIDNHINEIIWKRGNHKKSQNKFATEHDNILFYSKSSDYYFKTIYQDYEEDYLDKYYPNIEKDGRRYQVQAMYGKGSGPALYFGSKLIAPPKGLHWRWGQDKITQAMEEGIIVFPKGGEGMPRFKDYLDTKLGVPVRTIWDDVYEVNSQADERVDYPTQKPESLLERIIKTSSDDGALVADFFCGSGTTAVVAEKLGRRWIATDLGRYATHIARKRFLEIDGCKPFEILNIGKYERQYWQTFNFGKKTKEQTLAEYIAFILQLYKANALPGSAFIHGKRGNKLIHIGSVEAPVTFSDIQNALEETKRMKQKELVILGWEWEMGLHDVVEQEAKKAGIHLLLLSIPREAMDKRAVDAGDIQFFELAYLETETKKTKTGEYVIELTDFVIPNLDLIPAEVKKLIKKWSDYIDYWSVDWDYKNDTFHNQWQSYRTKKDRSLELKTDPQEYKSRGVYKVMIKVIDIFGNDTTRLVEIKH